MSTDKKKTAAISAAISAFTKQEGEYGTKSPSMSRSAPFSIWGLSGRQDMMRMRNLLQLRALRK